MESTRQPDFSSICNIFVTLADAVEKEVKKDRPKPAEKPKQKGSDFD